MFLVWMGENPACFKAQKDKCLGFDNKEVHEADMSQPCLGVSVFLLNRSDMK